MENTISKPKQKKSQKRVDRQARRAEKRKQKELLEKHKLEEQHSKPVRVRLSKKSLPGFLAKNVDAILTWLKEYETLFCLADDYGIQRLDRIPDKKRQLLVQNYVDISEFITTVEQIKKDEQLKPIEKQPQIKPQDNDQFINKEELDKLVEIPDDENAIKYTDEPEWVAIDVNTLDENGEKIQAPPPNYFEDVQAYVNSLSDEFEDDVKIENGN